MGNLNSTPKSSRVHISIFGRRNAGKSSIANALTRQSISLVSDIAGTTTDPVHKAMELLPIGPVVITDTAGLDDEGTLGELRVKRTLDVIKGTDLAVVVIDGLMGAADLEKGLLELLKRQSIPVVGVINKTDSPKYAMATKLASEKALCIGLIEVSASTLEGIEELKQAVIDKVPCDREVTLLEGLISPSDIVVMVIPIDKAAPKGRLILPQQQVIRDALDKDAIVITAKEDQLRETLEGLVRKPALVVTDSQAFAQVSKDTPNDIPLTSFSILMARQKGDLVELAKGAKAIADLRPGDPVLISEACTHHRQADDIGTVKIPRWLQQKVGGELDISWVSGQGFPDDLSQYKLVIHCGACMINRREMLSRLDTISSQEVPVVNYGVLIAYLNGILPRVIKPFPEARSIFA